MSTSSVSPIVVIGCSSRYLPTEGSELEWLPSPPFFFFNDTATTEIYTFPYTTLFRSARAAYDPGARLPDEPGQVAGVLQGPFRRSEEHTSELQSQSNLVCRLLLEKKKKTNNSEHAQSKPPRANTIPT